MFQLAALAVGAALVALSGCNQLPSAPTAPATSSGSAAMPAAATFGDASLSAKGGKPVADQPATAVFRCPGPGCSGTDRVTGDNAGGYAGRIWGSTGEFNLTTTAPRSLTIDYTDQIDSTIGRRWFQTITLNSVLLQTNTVYPGTDTEATGGLRAVPIGATWPARMKLGYLNVSPTGVNLEWGDRFNPGAFPGSTHIRVTRFSESQWSVESTTADVAHVRSIADRRGGAEVFEGFYRLPFQFVVTAQ